MEKDIEKTIIEIQEEVFWSDLRKLGYSDDQIRKLLEVIGYYPKEDRR